MPDIVPPDIEVLQRLDEAGAVGVELLGWWERLLPGLCLMILRRGGLSPIVGAKRFGDEVFGGNGVGIRVVAGSWTGMIAVLLLLE